jgi:hypothetical protein
MQRCRPWLLHAVGGSIWKDSSSWSARNKGTVLADGAGCVSILPGDFSSQACRNSADESHHCFPSGLETRTSRRPIATPGALTPPGIQTSESARAQRAYTTLCLLRRSFGDNLGSKVRSTNITLSPPRRCRVFSSIINH